MAIKSLEIELPPRGIVWQLRAKRCQNSVGRIRILFDIESNLPQRDRQSRAPRFQIRFLKSPQFQEPSALLVGGQGPQKSDFGRGEILIRYVQHAVDLMDRLYIYAHFTVPRQ